MRLRVIAWAGLWLAVAATATYYFDLIRYLSSAVENPTRYRTAPVERGDIVTAVAATGTVSAVVTTEVSSQLSGQIAELLVDFNDVVHKGQPLARLDPQSFDARVREATAELNMAKADVLTQEAAIEKAQADRTNALAARAVAEAEMVSAHAQCEEAERELGRRRALSKNAVVSQSDIEQAETRYHSTRALARAAEARLRVRHAAVLAAEAAVKMAEAHLQHARAVVDQKEAALEKARVDRERTEIRSPLDGVVIRRDIDVGTTVAASLHAPTLFTIAQDLRDIKVETKVDEADIGRIQVGQPVTFTVDAYTGRRFKGAVTQIRKAHQLFQNVVTYTVIVSAVNRDLALFPGMTAIVRITTERAHDVLRVPNAALRFMPAGRTAPSLDLASEFGEPRGLPGLVWILDESGEPQPIPVRIGTADAHFSAILSGPLQPGDSVIVDAIHAPEKKLFSSIR